MDNWSEFNDSKTSRWVKVLAYSNEMSQVTNMGYKGERGDVFGLNNPYYFLNARGVIHQLHHLKQKKYQNKGI